MGSGAQLDRTPSSAPGPATGRAPSNPDAQDVGMLQWDGVRNARDLGGLPLTGGGTTRFGQVARSDHPGKLTSLGWQQLLGSGVHAIVSLETGGLTADDALRANGPLTPPAGSGLAVVGVPIEDGSDQAFMDRWARTGLWGTPLYFADALQRWPHLIGRAASAIAGAPPMVLMHCRRGHDRTGIMAVVILTLVGATLDGIVEDYLLSARNLVAEDPASVTVLDEALAGAGVTAQAAIGAAVDVMSDEWRRRAGLTDATVTALRRRLVGPARDEPRR